MKPFHKLLAFVAGVLIVIAGIGVVYAVAWLPPDIEVSGEPECVEGDYYIDWTITNVEDHDSGVPAVIDYAVITPSDQANVPGGWIGSELENDGGQLEGTSVADGSYGGPVTLTVRVKWYISGHVADEKTSSATVHVGGDCYPPTTTTSKPVTTTTLVETTTTQEPSTTTSESTTTSSSSTTTSSSSTTSSSTTTSSTSTSTSTTQEPSTTTTVVETTTTGEPSTTVPETTEPPTSPPTVPTTQVTAPPTTADTPILEVTPGPGDLPVTGSSRTVAFAAVGVLLLAAGAILLWLRRVVA